MTISYKYFIALFVTCAVFVLGGAVLAYADSSRQPTKLIVVFEKDAYQNKEQRGKIISDVGGQNSLLLPFMNAVALEVPEKAAIQLLAHNPGVVGVYEDVEMSLFARPAPITPSQPAEVIDWGVDKIDAEKVWSTSVRTGYEGRGVNVAVLDTGIDADHPDLIANVKGGVGFVPREVWSSDGNGHGTHVSGTIGAVDNTIGVIGVANGTNIYGVQVLNKKGSGNLSYLLSGLNWAVKTHSDTNPDNDIDVVSMSLGFPIGTTLEQLVGLEEQLIAAQDTGIVVVAAAGNEGMNGVSYPAAYPTVIAVAATNADDTLASYSNYGAEVDVAAPGTSIRSTWKGATYNTISGTSMATPHIAGVSALILSKYPGLTNAEVRDRITSSLTYVTGKPFVRVDAQQALLD